jgi:hypothetical protein
MTAADENDKWDRTAGAGPDGRAVVGYGIAPYADPAVDVSRLNGGRPGEVVSKRTFAHPDPRLAGFDVVETVVLRPGARSRVVWCLAPESAAFVTAAGRAGVTRANPKVWWDYYPSVSYSPLLGKADDFAEGYARGKVARLFAAAHGLG